MLNDSKVNTQGLYFQLAVAYYSSLLLRMHTNCAEERAKRQILSYNTASQSFKHSKSNNGAFETQSEQYEDQKSITKCKISKKTATGKVRNSRVCTRLILNATIYAEHKGECREQQCGPAPYLCCFLQVNREIGKSNLYISTGISIYRYRYTLCTALAMLYSFTMEML